MFHGQPFIKQYFKNKRVDQWKAIKTKLFYNSTGTREFVRVLRGLCARILKDTIADFHARVMIWLTTMQCVHVFTFHNICCCDLSSHENDCLSLTMYTKDYVWINKPKRQYCKRTISIFLNFAYSGNVPTLI